MALSSLLVSIFVMSSLGICLSVTLAIANKKFYVYEDPRIDEIEAMLPSANCGACGSPGCRNFAELVVGEGINPAKCTVSAPEVQEAIANYLGLAVEGIDKKVARLACAGGRNVARQRARYEGASSCRAANLIAGGGKGCAWGCLGLADCAEVCDFDSISMNEHSLPVVDVSTCTACGDCVEICPKDLFSIHSLAEQLWVSCKSEAANDLAENECQVACTACARCVLDAPTGLLQMVNNLPVIDYHQNHLLNSDAIQRCPTGAIVWLELSGEITKGKGAKSIIRKSPLPIG